MILYHGTDEKSAKDICNKISLVMREKGLDFGPGFYATQSYKTAKVWAMRKANQRNSKPAIVIIEFDYYNAKPYITKFRDDLKWGQFVINNRNGKSYIDKMTNKEHNLDAKYDITYGRIADLDVRKIAKNLNKKGEPLQDVKDILNTAYAHQYAFHTEIALNFIKSVRYKIIK